MFNHRLLEKLKSIVNRNEERFSQTGALAEFCKDFNLGAIKGKSVFFSDDDKEQIRKILTNKGYSLDVSVDSSMSRVEKLNYGPNEKAGGGSLKRNRVSIKASGNKPLLLNGEVIQLPAMSHLDIDISQVNNTQHNAVILVENYENFNRFSETKMLLPSNFDNPMVVYRGDKNESRLDAVMLFLNLIKLPVLAAVDIDPFGLVNVMGINGLSAVLAPANEELDKLFSSPKTSRADLYESHYLSCHSSLDNLPEKHVCKNLWRIIKANKAGIVQEQFLALKLPLVLWQ